MKRKSKIIGHQGFSRAMALNMAEGWYRLFWTECGSKNKLTTQQKVDLISKIRDLSLREPISEIDSGEPVHALEGKTLGQTFPELIPQNLCPNKSHLHLTDLSGLMLYVIYSEMFWNDVKPMAERGELSEEQLKQLKG